MRPAARPLLTMGASAARLSDTSAANAGRSRGVGANLCGQCVVGENTFIGAGATVIQQRQIGNEAIVGAGCTIKRNIGNRCICKETDDGLASVQMEES